MEPEAVGPPGQRVVTPERQERRAGVRQDAEAARFETFGASNDFAIDLAEQPAEEIDYLDLRRLTARPIGEALPEGARRPLFAAAEEGPADVALVVLGARQGERHQGDEALVVQGGEVLGQLGGPVAVF